MILIVYNLTGSPKSYLSGDIIVPAMGNLTVSQIYYYALINDAQFRADIQINEIQVSDGVTNYGNLDALIYLERLIGLKDRDGRGLTSTNVTTDLTEHQALDVNIVSGAANGNPDRSTFTYGDTSFVPVGGVYNDSGTTVLSGENAAARITAERALHVNLRNSAGNEFGTSLNPIEVSVNPSAILESYYSEIAGLVSGVNTLVGSYTAVPNRKLQKIVFSGTNIAEYELVIAGVTQDKKRTYFGGALNDEFYFNDGLLLNSGDIVELYVIHNRLMTGDFNCRFQILEV